MNTERENEFPYCDDAGPFKLVTEGHYWKKVRPEDLLVSQNHPQPESSVATLACTEGNSIEQKIKNMITLTDFSEQRIVETILQTLELEQAKHLIQILNPRLVKDGNQWCYIWGDLPETCIAGFGDSPHSALINFAVEFHSTNRSKSDAVEEGFVNKHLLTIEKFNREGYVKDLDRIIDKLFFHFSSINDKLPSNADVGAIGAVTLVELRNLRDTIKNYDK